MSSRLFGTSSGFSSCIIFRVESIMWFCRFWQFLAKYVATLAYRVTKLERAKLEYETKKGDKFGQNRSTLSTRYAVQSKTDGRTDTFTDTRGQLVASRSKTRRTSARLQHIKMLDFRLFDSVMGRKFKNLNYIIIEPMNFKLHKMILDGRLHDCVILYQVFWFFINYVKDQIWCRRSKVQLA